MKKWKKYVKGTLAALFTVLGVILAIFLGLRFLRFFMPFVIGWIIAMIASPLVRMVEKRMKIARKHTSMLIIIAVLAAIIAAGYFIGAKAVEETSALIDQAPDIYSGFREDFQEVEHNLNKFMKQLPENVQTSINNVQDDLGERIGKLVGNISEWTVGYAGDMAKHLPNVLISIILPYYLHIFSLRTGMESWSLGGITHRRSSRKNGSCSQTALKRYSAVILRHSSRSWLLSGRYFVWGCCFC